MAMINQLNRRNGAATPYFIRGPPPPDVIPHTTAALTVYYGYPCSPHCRGVAVAPWMGPAAAVAPMIELDLDRQRAQDDAEFAAGPHMQLNPYERAQWVGFYNQLSTYDPDEPQNAVPREALRELQGRGMARDRYWAEMRVLAPAPPRPDPGMPAA